MSPSAAPLPPSPPPLRRPVPSPSRALLNKLLMIVLVMLVLQAPLWWIDATREERSERYAGAVREVTKAWGGPQTVTGPMLVVPYRTATAVRNGDPTGGLLRIAPETLVVEGEMEPRQLERGIYRAQVYAARLRLSGRFGALASVWPERYLIDWPRARLVVAVSDGRGLRAEPVLRWNGGAVALEGGSGAEAWPTGLGAAVMVDPAQPSTFELTLGLDGSEALDVVPLAPETRARLTSTWSAPKFQGAFLPKERTVAEGGFAADWEVGRYGRDLPAWWFDHPARNEEVAARGAAARFGVGWSAATDDYRMIERAIKYGILFLVTIFAGFFLAETGGGRALHALNYVLVGAALCLFFLALLALAEFLRFGWAYLGAAGAATLLVVLYASAVLGAMRRAAAIGVVLGGIYAYLFMVLCLEDLSLVAGTGLLFGLLAAIMYATRHLRLDERPSLAPAVAD